MRWKPKKKLIPKEYKVHDEKVTNEFSFFPKKLDDGYIVWLELYSRHWKLNMVPHRYMHLGDRIIDRGPGLKWQIIKEITK